MGVVWVSKVNTRVSLVRDSRRWTRIRFTRQPRRWTSVWFGLCQEDRHRFGLQENKQKLDIPFLCMRIDKIDRSPLFTLVKKVAVRFARESKVDKPGLQESQREKPMSGLLEIQEGRHRFGFQEYKKITECTGDGLQEC